MNLQLKYILKLWELIFEIWKYCDVLKLGFALHTFGQLIFYSKLDIYLQTKAKISICRLSRDITSFWKLLKMK